MLSGGGGLEIQAREVKREWSGPKVVQHANGTSRLVSPNFPQDAEQDNCHTILAWASYSYTMDRHHGHRNIPWQFPPYSGTHFPELRLTCVLQSRRRRRRRRRRLRR